MQIEATRLDLKRKEELTDKLLAYMKNDIERLGCTIDCVWFEFITEAFFDDEEKKYGKNYIAFKNYSKAQDDEIEAIIKSCIAHEYVKGSTNRLQLTRQGWARANSNEKAKLYTTSTEANSNYNFNGSIILNNSQIGNNNQQQIHIENDIENLLKLVEASNVSQDKKKEAKNLLLKFIEHPAFVSTLSSTAITYIKSLFGG